MARAEQQQVPRLAQAAQGEATQWPRGRSHREWRRLGGAGGRPHQGLQRRVVESLRAPQRLQAPPPQLVLALPPAQA